jgi:hypothetical protein
MGVRQEARIAHEKKIAKLQAELAPVDSAIVNEQTAEADIDREIAKLAIKAAHGDRAALKQQRELRVRKDEHHLQAENLEPLAVPIREAIAAAEAELPHFILAETHERVSDGIKELSKMSAELSKVIEPIAQALGEFRATINAATSEALALVARGNPDRIRYLENRARTMLVRGIRCQLAFEFRSVGLDIIDVGQFEGKDFQSVVRPVLDLLICALEVDLHTDGVATPGRATFRCLTRVGLFGLHLLPGEVVSLPTEHEQVRKAIELGALENIVDASESRNAEDEL